MEDVRDLFMVDSSTSEVIPLLRFPGLKEKEFCSFLFSNLTLRRITNRVSETATFNHLWLQCKNEKKKELT